MRADSTNYLMLSLHSNVLAALSLYLNLIITFVRMLAWSFVEVCVLDCFVLFCDADNPRDGWT